MSRLTGSPQETHTCIFQFPIHASFTTDISKLVADEAKSRCPSPAGQKDCLSVCLGAQQAGPSSPAQCKVRETTNPRLPPCFQQMDAVEKKIIELEKLAGKMTVGSEGWLIVREEVLELRK